MSAPTALVFDIHVEVETLRRRGVSFKTMPTQAGDVMVALFDDTCGNWIQLHQPKREA